MYLYCTEKPGLKCTYFWKSAPAEKSRFLEDVDVLNTSTSSLQFQVPLWKVLCKERDSHGSHGTTGRKTPVLIQVKTCSQLSCVLVFPFPRACEAAELLYFSCVSTNTSVLTLLYIKQWLDLGDNDQVRSSCSHRHFCIRVDTQSTCAEAASMPAVTLLWDSAPFPKPLDERQPFHKNW